MTTENTSTASNAEPAATPLEWAPLWEAMKPPPYPWILTTEKMFWDMLGAVPPRAQRNDGFLVGEPDSINANGETLYACFMQQGELTKARYMTVREFNARTYPAF